MQFNKTEHSDWATKTQAHPDEEKTWSARPAYRGGKSTGDPRIHKLNKPETDSHNIICAKTCCYLIIEC